jgi:hypothetical protein
MDTLLVHMAGRPARLPAEATPDFETVVWHPEAAVVMTTFAEDDLPLPRLDARAVS